MRTFMKIVGIVGGIAAAIARLADALISARKAWSSDSAARAQSAHQTVVQVAPDERASALRQFRAYYGRYPSQAELQRFLLEEWDPDLDYA